MSQLPKIKSTVAALAAVTGLVLSSDALSAVASYNPADNSVTISAVDVPSGRSHVGAPTFRAKLAVTKIEPQVELRLLDATGIAKPNTDRAHFDNVFGQVFIPSITVGGKDYSVVMQMVPGSNPLTFRVTSLHPVAFSGCPSFAKPAVDVPKACVLEGTYTKNLTLTNDITWLVSGAVLFGNDNKDSITVTVEPDTKIKGRKGLDFVLVNRGSKMNAIGTPQHPIIMTGPLEQAAGEWGGLVIAGNAPVNGCTAGTALCEQTFEALPQYKYGGNTPNDNSGIYKYISIRYAGFEVRPNEELNCFTMMGVGSGTTIDFAQCHQGLDDGFEMFGGTVNLKHLVATENDDDGFDWQIGWVGKAQYVYVKTLPDGSDHGIEADNNQNGHDSLPRSKGIISNFTMRGTGIKAGGHGIVLRRGTAANIYNSVITNFGNTCITINDAATYAHAGTPAKLSGSLTMENSYVHNCITKTFNDVATNAFLVSDWFKAQPGNVEGDPMLSGYLPRANSPLKTAGKPVPGNDPFFDAVNFVGAFANENDDWAKGWTVGLE